MHEIISASRLCLVFFLCSFCLNSFFLVLMMEIHYLGKSYFHTKKKKDGADGGGEVDDEERQKIKVSKTDVIIQHNL